MPSLSPTAPRFFRKDLERLNYLLNQNGAVQTAQDGAVFLQPGVLPDVQETYANLTSYGWAQGWLVP